jgi:hypothetical protein
MPEAQPEVCGEADPTATQRVAVGQETPVRAIDPSSFVVHVVPPSVVSRTEGPPTAAQVSGDAHAIARSDAGVRTFCCVHVLPPSADARTIAVFKVVSPTA